MTILQTVSSIPSSGLHSVLGWRGFVLAFARDPVGFLTSLHNKYGKIAHVGQGKMSATFTFHPDYTRQILSNSNLFYSFNLEDIPFPFSDIEGLKSLTTAISLLNGEQHKRQRRLMLPAFHTSILPVYIDQITRAVDEFFSKWKYGNVVDIQQEIDLFTVMLSIETFVGMDANEALVISLKRCSIYCSIHTHFCSRMICLVFLITNCECRERNWNVNSRI
jgi:cytochrome P450